MNFSQWYWQKYLLKYKKHIGAFYLKLNRFLHPHFKVGENPNIWGKFHVTMFENSKIQIGNKLHMVSDAERSMITLFSRCQLRTFENAEIIIGNSVQLNGSTIVSKKRIQIGDHVQIAPNVIIVDSDFHKLWPPEKRWGPDTEGMDEEVKIGKHVWIGMNSIVLKGTEIGDNTIIGAGSVVMGKIPENVIAAGNPARVIKTLNEL